MNASQRYEQWNSRTLEDGDLTAELAAIAGSEQEIYERFYTELEFGTAGLRGILGAGTNRMNIYTVRRATRGLARYIKSRDPNGSAAIACDTRNKSTLFAQQAAAVLAGEGIRVWLYREPAPTPMLSWAVRYYGCTAGIVVTASHNPAEYNGYKVYGADGCQMTSEGAGEVYQNILELGMFDSTPSSFEEAVRSGMVSFVEEKAVEEYCETVLGCRVDPTAAQSGLSIVYTPLNGTGNVPVREVLSRAGYQDVTVVPQQELPNGDFPTCPYPNPETADAMALGIKLTEELGADLLIGTDPDADRVGVGVRSGSGVTLLTGNDVGVLLTDYIGRVRSQDGSMPKRPVLVKSIVSTTLAERVAAHYGIETANVLTGFKYIGETILKLEQKGEENRFVFGFEESCGYLPGSYVRDKDGVAASLLIAEMAAFHKRQGKTLLGVLEEIYERFGYLYNHVTNTAFAGSDGMRKMAAMMDRLFASPPETLGEYAVAEYHDLRNSTAMRGGTRSPIALPPAEVMILHLENDATVVIRPSGTEPKLKVYYMASGASMQQAKALAGQLERAVTALLGL